MSGDDEQVWAELVESFHTSPDDTSGTWPAAEDVDPEDAAHPGNSAHPGESGHPAGSNRAGESGHPAGSGRASTFSGPGGEGDTDFTDSTDHPSGDAAGAPDDPDGLAGEGEHFVPPPPPPLPRTDLITAMAWAGVLGTPVLFLLVVLAGKTLSGWPALVATGAFIGGFTVLITRLRGHSPHDPDDGAVV